MKLNNKHKLYVSAIDRLYESINLACELSDLGYKDYGDPHGAIPGDVIWGVRF